MARQFVLRYFSGEGRGGSYLVKEPETFIGREAGVHVRLLDGRVSRRHARLRLDGDNLWLDDLDSQNGTFVNGREVKSLALQRGDWILIGSSLIRVSEEGDVAAPVSWDVDETIRVRLETLPPEGISGSLDELPIADLVQIVAATGKTRRLLLKSAGRTGRIEFRDGRVRFALLEGLPAVRPHKAFYRMLEWTSGSFDLLASEETIVGREIEERIEHLLMEGMRQIDESRELRLRLEAGHGTLRPSAAARGPAARELGDRESEVLGLAAVDGRIEAVLDRSVGTDLEALLALESLVSKGLLE